MFSPSDISRFYNKVLVTSSCHVWMGAKFHYGHGVFRHKGKNLKAHRVALILQGIEVPSYSTVNHYCDVPQCVNPAHLYVGTQKQNCQDRELRGRGNSVPPVLVGEHNPKNKLSDSQVDEIRGLIADGFSNVQIAAKYSVNHRTISTIRTGRRKGGTSSHACAITNIF